jgi:hypothetical protein
VNTIDIFMDLEGLGISWDRSTGIRKIDFITDTLPTALEQENYTISTLTGFARYKHKNSIEQRSIQTMVRNKFSSYGWKMVWSNEFADLALIKDAEERLLKNSLAPTVMLVTNDHDFIKITRKITNSGRFVIISGPNMSKRLQHVAGKSFPFWQFLGGHPEKILPDDTDASRHIANNESIRNPILIPGF